MGRKLVRRNRRRVNYKPKMDFSSRNARLLSTFGLMGILTFLISTMFKYIEGSSRIINVEAKIPFDLNDVLSASLMSSVVIIFYSLIIYCYHEFSSFTIEVDDKIINKSDDSYKKVIFLIPFLLGLNVLVFFITMVITTTTLNIGIIILIIVIAIGLVVLINFVSLGNINLHLSYKLKIQLSFLLLSLFFICVNIINTNLSINMNILFKNDGQIEYDFFGPMPYDINITVIDSENRILVKKQIEDIDLNRAFLEYTEATNYDQIPNNNAKIEKTINIDDNFYKYHFIDIIDPHLFKRNEKYVYIIQVQYNGYFMNKYFKAINEFYCDDIFNFTQESFTFSE